MRSAAFRTEGCSTAEARIRRRAEPWIARVLASVPPLVKTTAAGAAPASAATWMRASSIIARAARPKLCTDDGLPAARVNACCIASSAASRNGVVAL